MLTEDDAVGKVVYSSGQMEVFYDPAAYVETVQREFPQHRTKGFTYMTLTHDPIVRKAVDDIWYEAFGLKNPHDQSYYDALHGHTAARSVAARMADAQHEAERRAAEQAGHEHPPKERGRDQFIPR